MTNTSSVNSYGTRLIGCSAIVLALVIVASHPMRCQFLQPQSHLGRLVQSIASPLVLSSSLGSSSDPSDSYDPEAGLTRPTRPDEHQQGAHHYQPEAGQHYQHYQRESDFGPRPQPQYQQQQQPAMLQQAPSQQRGIPQRYYDGPQNDEEAPAGHTASHRQQPAANEQYQMGAYLGPTIDDKEIQGAFNSNDDRDDDDAPGYDGPMGGSGRQGGRQSQSYAASQPESSGGYPMGDDQSSYGPSASRYGGDVGHHQANSHAASGAMRGERGGPNFDDESSADEDDEPSPVRRQPRFRQSGMSQAASQYHQRQNLYPSNSAAPMMAAANGYSPMGAGPFDLNSLMAAAAGGAGNGQAYEVYNGDGSYPGYYPQQGRVNQAASMNNPYGYQQMGGYQNQNQNQDGDSANQQGGNNGGGGGNDEDADADADED